MLPPNADPAKVELPERFADSVEWVPVETTG